MSDLMNTIQQRRSIRRFQERDLPDDILTKVDRALYEACDSVRSIGELRRVAECHSAIWTCVRK